VHKSKADDPGGVVADGNAAQSVILLREALESIGHGDKATGATELRPVISGASLGHNANGGTR
jgi:hypothetical protein